MSDETKSEESETTEDEVGKLIKVGTDFISTVDVPASILRNAAKALNQLCSAIVSWPVAFLEGKAAEEQAASEARIKLMWVSTDQIAQQMKVNPEYARRAANKFAGKIIREQRNLDAVSAIAVDELNAEQPASSINQHANNDDEQTINDDWLNTFEEEARQISTEEMQTLFGRILAGEIRKPGSYSIRAVKILGELDQNTAALFKKLCSISLVLEDLCDKYDIIDARVPTLGRDPEQDALNKYGLGLRQLNVLMEYGLVISNHASFAPFHLCLDMGGYPSPYPFRHQGRFWVLYPAYGVVGEYRLSGVTFSKTGRELLRIVELDSMEEYTEDLKNFLAGQQLHMVEIQNR